MSLDLAIRGDTVLTMNPGSPIAEAVGVRGGEIAAVGSWADVSAMCGRKTEVIDAGNHDVIPGFVDGHFHLLDYARGFLRLSLVGARSLEECVERVADAHRSTPEDEWITGRGWNHDDWDRPCWPHRRDLDEAVGDRKVFLTRKDGHSGWLSTAALKACGLWDAGTDLVGLRMEDGDGQGRPTGLVHEHALDRAWDGVPDPSDEQTRDCLLRACTVLNRLGITAVHDCGGGAVVSHLRLLEDAGLLTLRCWATLSPESLSRWEESQESVPCTDSRVHVGGLKVFVDGSLGSRTAFLTEPYEDDPSNRGILLLSRDELTHLLARAAEQDLCLVAHVIGDGAVREVMDAVEGFTGKTRGIRLEHLQLIHPGDVPRLGRYPYVASMQPYHLSTDIRVAGRAWGGRCRKAYAWASVAARVPVLAFGSDCPVEPPDPRLGLWAAVTRHGADGRSRGGWFPDERLSLTQALWCYTRGGAEASGDCLRTGSIEPGKRADLVVLEGATHRWEAADIRTRGILLTVLEGKVVHRDQRLS
jgi:predicted amidohydrolase YtcJ